MKQITNGVMAKSVLTFLVIAFAQILAFGQDGGSGSSSGTSANSKSVTVTTESTDWYTGPWIWVAGAVLLILVLVALLRGRSSDRSATTRTDRVTVSRTSTSDDLV